MVRLTLRTTALLLALGWLAPEPARASATGCTCITQGLIPLTITTPGSCWQLALPVTGPAGLPAIVINANDVTIDLAGKTLTTGAGGVAISTAPVAGLRGLTVRNGAIAGNFGLTLASMREVVVEDVIFSGLTGQAIGLTDTTGVTIRRNLIRSAGPAIAGGGGATNLLMSGIIEGNEIAAGGTGITLVNVSGLAVLDNRIVGEPTGATVASGITIDNAIGSIVAENTIANTSAWGIAITNSTGSTFADNDVRGAAFDGMLIVVDDSMITRNTVSASGRHGLLVDGARNLIEDNALNSNGAAFPGSVGLLLSNNTSGNVYRDNLARNNSGPFPGCPGSTSDFCDISVLLPVNTPAGTNFTP